MAIAGDIETDFGPVEGAYLRVEHLAWLKDSNTASYALVAYKSKDAALKGLRPVRNWSFQFNPTTPGPVSQACCYVDARSRVKGSAAPKRDDVKDLVIDRPADA